MKSRNMVKHLGAMTGTLLSALLLTGLTTPVMAEENVPITSKVIIQDENTSNIRPESVIGHLAVNGTEVAQGEGNEENEYTIEICIPMPDETTRNMTLYIDPVEGYTEDLSQHIDPMIVITNKINDDWEKYEPCNELEIPTEKLGQGIIAAKTTKHGPMIVWTPEELTAEEQAAIIESVSKQPGVGNLSSAVFLVGDATSDYGINVLSSKGLVMMDEPSDWALLYGGTYSKIVSENNSGVIVFKPDPTDPDESIIDDPENPTDPDDPVIDDPENPTDPDDPIIDDVNGSEKNQGKDSNAFNNTVSNQNIPNTGIKTGNVLMIALMMIIVAGLSILWLVLRHRQLNLNDK